MIQLSREELARVREVIDERNRTFVRVNHIDDYLDMSGEAIGTALSRLEDEGELKFYNDTNIGKMYRVK